MVKTIYKNPCVNSQSHPVIPNYAVIKTELCTCKILDARAKRASRIALEASRFSEFTSNIFCWFSVNVM